MIFVDLIIVCIFFWKEQHFYSLLLHDRTKQAAPVSQVTSFILWNVTGCATSGFWLGFLNILNIQQTVAPITKTLFWSAFLY